MILNSIIKEELDKLTNSPFAVFVLSKTKNNLIAATTRAKDTGESGKIGLPGGKVDPNEDPKDAAKREAYEEGWDIEIGELIHTYIVDGKTIWWYKGYNPQKLTQYKEMHRIKPIEVSVDEISKSGYGNWFISADII